MTQVLIPRATGVPGNFTPPDWLSNTPPPFDGSPDDPRWVASYANSFGDGVDQVQVLFRGLTDAAKTKLLLSWLVNVDPLVTPGQDSLYVGFGTADGLHAVLVTVQLATVESTTFGTFPKVYTPKIQLFSNGTWSDITLTPNELGNSWFVTGTRAWINYGSAKTPWAIQMVVPVGQVLNPKSAAPDQITLQAAAKFKMWYDVVLYTPFENQPPPVIPYFLPGTQDLGSNPPANLTPNIWADASVSNDVQPVGISIGIHAFDVGTQNPDFSSRNNSSEVHWDPSKQDASYDPNHKPPIIHSNIFYAKPTFPGTPDYDINRKKQVQARFRMANWGSSIGAITPQSWQDIPGGVGVSWSPDHGECAFPWPTQVELTGSPAQTGPTLKLLDLFNNGTTTRDQCLLVQLSSSFDGEIFLNDSFRQNMTLVGASKFSRSAEISVVGLEPFSLAPRDVYLYLETVNMPTRVIDESPPQSPPIEEPRLLSTRGGRQDVPTYRVHVYHDTGKRTTLGGVSRPILKPQSSFGYFAQHDGNLIGWAARLHGAIRIAENFYLLRVPNNGVAKVNTVIQAIENANEPIDPEDPIVPIPPPVTVTGSERFFIGFFSHGGVASVENFPDRFVSLLDNYAYKQSEVRYEYHLHSTRLPVAGFVQGQRNPPDDADAGSGPGNLFLLLWNLDDSTGRVSLHTSYSLQRGEEGEEREETRTHDGCVKVYAVCQRGAAELHARVYYIEAPNMDPDVVRQIQLALSKNGQNPGPVDGDYGPKTAAAVAAFQAAHGLVANGEVGPETAQALGIQL
jgi:Putative peptidoglycan binding domain